MTNCIIPVQFYSRMTFTLTCVHGDKMQGGVISSTRCILGFVRTRWLLVTAGDCWTGERWCDLFVTRLISVKMSHSWWSGTLVPSQCVTMSQLACLGDFLKAFHALLISQNLENQKKKKDFLYRKMKTSLAHSSKNTLLWMVFPSSFFFFKAVQFQSLVISQGLGWLLYLNLSWTSRHSVI